MKLLAIAPCYADTVPGGAEWSLHELLLYLQGRGHEVLVATPGNRLSGAYTWDGIRICPGAEDRAFWPGHYDIILTQLSAVSLAKSLGRRHRKPVAYWAHGPKQSRQRCDLLICATHQIEGYAETRRNPSPRIVLHPPHDPARYQVTHGERIGQVNMMIAKGGPVFFDTAVLMRDQKFVGVWGAYGSQWKPAWGIPGNVWMQDNHADPRDFYRQCKVVMMPSTEEAYGRVAIEAAASGIPAVVCDLPGPREAVGDAGNYAPPGQPGAAWEHAIRQVFIDYDDRSRAALARSEAVRLRTAFELAAAEDALASLIP